MRTGFLIILFSLFCASSYAQKAEPEMADVMRSEGKIYVVVAILLLVLAGVAAYLFLLDRKITRLEHSSREKNG